MQVVSAVGGEAVVLGAFGSGERVMDQRAMTVLQAQEAGAALSGHVTFLALGADESGLPR